MDAEAVFAITIIIIAVLIVTAAWYWEVNEIKALENRDSLSEIPSDERELYLQEMACFSWTEAVSWRRIVIGTVIATFLIYLFLHKKIKCNVGEILIIAFVILATFMVLDLFKTYHIDRVICQKATDTYPWFQHSEEA